jgi:cysteine desulfurase
MPVQKNGIVDLAALEKVLQEHPDTAVVSVMAVNNEIGVVQPLDKIGALCRKYKAFFHTDAAQALGKIELDVNKMNIDMMSLSGHKIYGPRGIGALFVRRKPRVRLEAVQSGGGQERGLRSGTVAPSLAVGFGKACEIAKDEMANDQDHVRNLYVNFFFFFFFWSCLNQSIKGLSLTHTTVVFLLRI